MRPETELALELYARAGRDAGRPPPGGAAQLAIDLYGRGCLLLQPRAVSEASVAVLLGRQRIALRSPISPQRANFLIAQMLARLLLRERSIVNVSLERAVAACVVAPPTLFTARFHQVGVRLSELARPFGITETCAARRLSEIDDGPDAVVTTPRNIYRGRQFLAGFSDEAIRALAAARRPRSVRRVDVRDEPGRVVLLAAS